jgi:hypothetical protein
MEIKVIQRHFGCISTSIDDGSKLSVGGKQAAINSWRPAAQKIRVFGSPVPLSHGVTVVKSATPSPSLKAIFEDYYLAVRGKGPLVLTAPNVAIKPVCIQLIDYAESKNMGISWAFYAFTTPGDAVPAVFGLTSPVVKILAQETPPEILFEDGKWQEWLFKWIRKYMQAHRYFDATRFLLANKWPDEKPFEGEYLTDGPINVYEKMQEVLPPEPWPEPAIDQPVSLVNPLRKKRGPKPKSK